MCAGTMPGANSEDKAFGFPHGAYIFQDYWEIRIGHRQPGIALTERVQHLGF